MHSDRSCSNSEFSQRKLPALVAGLCATFASVGLADEQLPVTQDPPPAVVAPVPEIEKLVLPPHQEIVDTAPGNPEIAPETQMSVEVKAESEPILPELVQEPEGVVPAQRDGSVPAAEEQKAVEANLDSEPILPEFFQEQKIEMPVGVAAEPGPVLDATKGRAVAVEPASASVENRTVQSGPESSAGSYGDIWRYAQNGALWVTLIGIPFLWLTWRKRADEALDRWKVNDEIKSGRLESDIRLNVHRFEEKNGTWSMQILNTGRVTVKELFGDQLIYAEVLGKAASLSDASQPFPIFNFAEALGTFNQKVRAFVRRTSLPTESLMSYNCRVRTRDLISAEFNPERRSLDPDRTFEQRRIFGILVREKSPQASTLVLCVIPESSFARFGDPAWVEDLKANSDAHDIARIDQLKLAYEKERDFLLGNSGKSVFPWANVLFPINTESRSRAADGSDVRKRNRANANEVVAHDQANDVFNDPEDAKLDAGILNQAAFEDPQHRQP